MKKIINHPNRFLYIGTGVGVVVGILMDSFLGGLALGIAAGMILTGKEKQKKRDE
jgi:hypothetical protein